MAPKFRAWLKETCQMVNIREMEYIDDKVYYITSDTGLCTYDEFKLMLSTGIKDKNNKEIFEGDILKFTIDNGFDYVVGEYGVVTYMRGAFFIVKDLTMYLISYINSNNIEVLGNIYEDSELLE